MKSRTALSMVLLLVVVSAALVAVIHRRGEPPRADAASGEPPAAEPAAVPATEMTAEAAESDSTEPGALAIRGVVVDEQGTPLELVTVAIDREGPPAGALFFWEDTHRTGADGAFSFEEVAPGSWVLGVMLQGWTRELRRGCSAGDEDLRVAIESGATVAGTVSTPDGEPALGATVRTMFTTAVGGFGSEVSARDGRFRWRGHDRGHLELRATCIGYTGRLAHSPRSIPRC